MIPAKELITPQALYVHISEFNRIKSENEKLKLLNVKIKKEKKKLKIIVENMIKNYGILNENKKNMETMFFNIQQQFKLISERYSSPKQSEFSTTSSFVEIISTKNNSNNQIIYKLQNDVISLKEVEKSYNKMTQTFNSLLIEYNLKPDHYELINNLSKSFLEETNIVKLEFLRQNLMIEKIKEHDKCLLNTILNTLFLNIYHIDINNKDNNNDKGTNEKDRICCEPIPSFIKFMNKLN